MKCVDACESFWKPLTVESATPTASSSGVGKLAVIKRPDGRRQVTADGKLLYTFADDSGGQIKGIGFADDFHGLHFTRSAVLEGVVYAYRGTPSWIFVYVDAAHRSATYTVELAMTSGERAPMPSFRIDPATGSAGEAIPFDLHRVAAVRLVGSTRGDVLEARLPHAAGDNK